MATLGAYETMEGKVGGRTAPFCVFRAGLRRKGLGEEAVAQVSGGQQDVPSEDKRAEELQGETPSGWERALGMSKAACPCPTEFSAADTLPAWDSPGALPVSPETFSCS